MYFSDHFDIGFSQQNKWFDPFLDKDCRVFIDPLLVYRNKEPEFHDARKKIAAFFEDTFALVKESIDHPSDKKKRQKALRALSFPEPAELCLGYSEESIEGRGTGTALAEMLFEAIKIELALNLDKEIAFETVSLFVDNLGADGISDMVATILKEEIVKYTQRICIENKIPMTEIGVKAIRYNFSKHIWEDGYVQLPINPNNRKGRSVLLVPKNFLRAKLSITQLNFKHFLLDTVDNEDLREGFGKEVIKDIVVNAKTMMTLVKKKFQYLKDYIGFAFRENLNPYNFEDDPKNLYRLDRDAQLLSSQFSAPPKIETESDFKILVRKFCENFKTGIENDSGNKVLWADNKPRKEKIAQHLFTAIGKSYSRAYDLDLSPEASTNRGFVDFKLSRGNTFRALIEIKLASNPDWWQGLNKQLPTYLESEKVKIGQFILIGFTNKDIEKFKFIPKALNEINKKNVDKFKIGVTTINASIPPTASKLK